MTEHLKLFDNKPDMITLPDNYLTDQTNQNSYPITDYISIHKTDITVYVNTNLHITTIDDITIKDTSTIITEIHETANKTNPIHTIIHLYRRPNTDIPEFIQNTQKAIDKIYERHPTTDLTLHGDTNINLYTTTKAYYDSLIENNLHTTIITPTRYDPHHDTATLIDNTLTTLTDTEITAGTISPPITDHLPTCTIFHKPTPRNTNTNKTLTTAQYNRNKHDILMHTETAITRTLTDTHPDTTTSQHFHNIQIAIQSTIETYERKQRRRRNHWITPRFKRHIQKQHQLYKDRLENPTPENKQKHKQYRKKLRRRITLAKKQSLTERLDTAKHDPKQRMKILNTVIPKKNTTRTSPTTLTYEDKTYTHPQDIANALNDNYITIGEKTTNTIPRNEDDYIENEQNDGKNTPTFKLQHTTEEIVITTMNKINRNKASDIYKIKPTIIKDLTPFLSPILTELFNRSIDENQYPDSLKLTKAIELYKANDRTLPANYRPISLLPIIAKLLDTIINQQLMKHLLEYHRHSTLSDHTRTAH